MNKENTEKIFNRFPTMFKPSGSPQETLMCFGFECGDGWFQLIWDACEKIEQFEKTRPIHEQAKNQLSEGGVEIVQVKEKYGGLRIYTSAAPEGVWELLQEAEDKSMSTCEVCGKPGNSLNDTGWISTLCDECRRDK